MSNSKIKPVNLNWRLPTHPIDPCIFCQFWKADGCTQYEKAAEMYNCSATKNEKCVLFFPKHAKAVQFVLYMALVFGLGLVISQPFDFGRALMGAAVCVAGWQGAKWIETRKGKGG